MRARDVLPDRQVLDTYEALYGELAANRCKWCQAWFMQTETGRRVKEGYHVFCTTQCRKRYESRHDYEKRKQRRAEGLK